ncbi:MAG: hypothetical protein IKL05_03865 [Clostridia bacterium]|nr:hypothetical protein [Clostridia bacterium]
MKRLGLLTLVFVLCVMVTSCNKTVTPPEEEISGEQAPIEEQMSTEEQTPVEEQKKEVQIPEAVEGFDVVYLPDADENTVCLTVDFPEDFPEEPYKMPELVSPEEFEWGEYGVFAQHINENASVMSNSVYSYAFLGEGVKTVEEGDAVYNKFNDTCRELFSIPSYCYDTETLPDGYFKEYIKGVTENRVIDVSEDLSRIEMLSFECIGEEGEQIEKLSEDQWQSTLWTDGKWISSYTVYQGNVSVFKDDSTTNDVGALMSSNYINWNLGNCDIPRNTFYLYETANQSGFYRKSNYKDDDYIIFQYVVLDNNYYIVIFSLEEQRMLYKIKYPYGSHDSEQGDVFEGFQVEDFCEDGILFTVSRNYLDENWTGYSKTYFYDLDKRELIFLEDYAFTPKLSPDGKLLAYTNSDYEWTNPEQPAGFYVKNLENETTVFYSYEDGWGSVDELRTRIEGFVRKDTLEEIIK